MGGVCLLTKASKFPTNRSVNAPLDYPAMITVILRGMMLSRKLLLILLLFFHLFRSMRIVKISIRILLNGGFLI